MSWTLIEHQALTSSVASVTLGSGGTIPQTYKTLKVVVSARNSVADQGMDIQPNAATTNLSFRYLIGDGGTASSGTATSIIGWQNPSDYTANTFGSMEVTIPNYSGSTNKPLSHDGVSENNGTSGHQIMGASLWSSTAAITSVKFVARGGGNFVSGSTFTLYGLA